MGEFVVVGEDRIVQAWSRFRLPFEPRGVALEFRGALRAAIAGLTAGATVHCAYGSEVRGFCDAENVLLYNIDMSSFRPVGTTGIAFERSYDVPASPSREPYGHYYRYAVDHTNGFMHWEPTAVVARWRGRVPDGSATRPDMWWLGTATAAGERMSALDAGQPFGLRIRLGAGRLSLTSVLKPMLDGVIAALHIDPAPPPLAVERLASKLALPVERVGALLRAANAPMGAPLGARVVVRPYRSAVQWNPADDRCVACAVTVDHDLEPGTVAGELLLVQRAGARSITFP